MAAAYQVQFAPFWNFILEAQTLMRVAEDLPLNQNQDKHITALPFDPLQ